MRKSLQRRRREIIQAATTGRIESAEWSASTLLWWVRKQAGITQAQLAESIGRNRITVASWEEERKRIPVNDWLDALQRCGYRVTLELIDDE